MSDGTGQAGRDLLNITASGPALPEAPTIPGILAVANDSLRQAELPMNFILATGSTQVEQGLPQSNMWVAPASGTSGSDSVERPGSGMSVMLTKPLEEAESQIFVMGEWRLERRIHRCLS